MVAKLTPEGGRIGEVARAAVEAGADAVSGTANRLGIPPIDINRPETLAWRLQRGNSLGCLSGPWLKPLALRDVFQMRTAIGPAPVLLGTGGIRDFRDAVEMCLVGADFFGVCTEVMLRGYALLARILRDLRAYLKETGRGSLSQARDAALPHFRSSERIETLPGHARVDAAACTGCGTCARIAHCGAIRIAKRKASIDREACRGCSTCVDVCPEGALAMVES